MKDNHDWTPVKTALDKVHEAETSKRDAWLEVGRELKNLREQYPADKDFGKARKAAVPGLSRQQATKALWLAGLPDVERRKLFKASGADTPHGLYKAHQKSVSPGDSPTPPTDAPPKETGWAVALTERSVPEALGKSEQAVRGSKKRLEEDLGETIPRTVTPEQADLLADKVLSLYGDPDELIAEAEAAKAELAKTPRAKLERAARLQHRAMLATFNAEVARKVEEMVSAERATLAKLREQATALREEREAELEKATQIRLGLDSHMTREEFRLVRGLLHPDKHNGDARYQRAFDIFNRLEKTINDKQPIAAKRRKGWA